MIIDSDVDIKIVARWPRHCGPTATSGARGWLDDGSRISLDGDLPVNLHGGQLSEGRTHGFGFIYEAVLQLRHDTGDRKVNDATTAVVTSRGGTPSGVHLLQQAGA
jgi:hypothetical protein